MAARFLAISLPVIFALFSFCERLTGGAGGETTNGMVTGALLTNNGSYCSGTQVRLFPAQFDPIKDTAAISLDTTDSLGKYSFSNVPEGDYTVLAVRAANGTRALVSGIHIGNDTYTDIAPTRTLLEPGSIKVSLPSGSNSALGYVYIPGTSRYVFLNNRTDFVVLDSVPADTIPSVSYSLTNSTLSTVIRYAVSVLPSDTAVLWNPSWSHARTLMLNTSVTGANVTGDVVDFPVLVRLNDDNFDFSQAQDGGADIRFTKSDNTPLLYEIERWNASKRMAEIWVKADTVRGNDSAQSITMYWGNPRASDSSNSAAVFDSAAGFIAVWHLEGNCADASGRGHDGINYGSRDTEGVIGSSKKFDGGDSIKIAGMLGTPATVTLSGWVKTDTTAASGQDIISLGDAVLIREDEMVNAYGTGGYAHRYTRGGDTAFTKVTSGLNIAKTGWRHVAFTFNNEAQVHALYIDGVAVSVDNSAYAIDYTGVGVNTFIGAHGNNKKLYNNRGLIDEVRVCGVARSADWIKLCYMNQRTDDKLIVFK